VGALSKNQYQDQREKMGARERGAVYIRTKDTPSENKDKEIIW